jgi:hypothetical protein
MIVLFGRILWRYEKCSKVLHTIEYWRAHLGAHERIIVGRFAKHLKYLEDKKTSALYAVLTRKRSKYSMSSAVAV